jgi:hypothetical protein
MNATERGGCMLGALFNEKEVQELEYVLKREMEELLLDLEDDRIQNVVKRAMEERYQLIFCLFRRFATPTECSRYMRSSAK